MYSVLSTSVSFISVLHSLNGAQFLNATFVFASPLITVIFLVTKNIHQNNHKDLILMNLLKI